MKKENIKNRLKITAVSIITLFATTICGNTLYAQEELTVDPTCYNDWLSFVSSVVSYDSFTEYWKDIFYRYNKNICHYMDIANVQKQMDSLRNQIRNTFYSCNLENAVSLGQRYIELEAELFYLRNFVEFPQSKVEKLSDEKIYKNMLDKYLYENDFYTDEQEVRELFERYRTKYENRVETYSKCEDPGLSMLMEKWDSLVENFKAMSESTEKAVKSNWNRAVNTPVKRTNPFTLGNLNDRLNNLPPPKTIDEIKSELQKEIPGETQPTLESLQSAVSLHHEENVEKTNEATLMAKYETLYKKGGDNSTKSLVEKLKEINKLVNDTLPVFDSLESCAKKTEERQCS
jgi:hypothetical protein